MRPGSEGQGPDGFVVRVVEVTEGASVEVWYHEQTSSKLHGCSEGPVEGILREAGNWSPRGGHLASVVQGKLMAPQTRPGTSL